MLSNPLDFESIVQFSKVREIEMTIFIRVQILLYNESYFSKQNQKAFYLPRYFIINLKSHCCMG